MSYEHKTDVVHDERNPQEEIEEISQGWIKLHRKLWRNPRSIDPEWVAVWAWMLCEASHSGIAKIWEGKRVWLKPGQLISGRFKVAEKTGVNESKVKRLWKIFVDEGQIDQQAGNKSSLFTIRNWHLYQKRDQQLPSRCPADDQQLPTSQEGKEGQRTKKKGSPAKFPSEIQKQIDATDKAINDIKNQYYHPNAGWREGSEAKRQEIDDLEQRKAELTKQLIAA